MIIHELILTKEYLENRQLTEAMTPWQPRTKIEKYFKKLDHEVMFDVKDKTVYGPDRPGVNDESFTYHFN